MRISDWSSDVCSSDLARSGLFVEPFQLTLNLQRQFTGGRNYQRQRIAGRCQPLRITQNFGGAGKTESNGFSRSGLGGNDQVAASSFRLQHCLLDGCEGRVSARGECVAERRRQIGKRHSISRTEEHTSELQSLKRNSY